MRRALGVASVLTILSLAGPALAESFGITPDEPPPPAQGRIAGGVGSIETPFSSPKIAPRPGAERVYAVVGEHLVAGVATPDGFTANGALVLRDVANPDFLCLGRFSEARYGGPNVRLACSDGSQVSLKTQEFTDETGFARRAKGNVAASMTYGFRAKAAAGRLVAPAGYVVVADDGVLSLKRDGA